MDAVTGPPGNGPAGGSRGRRRIPEATVARLPLYLRSLADVAHAGTSTVSSERLAELAGVKDVMTQNIDAILNRGERLDLLMNRTDHAANQSMAFRRRAVGLRREMWYKNVKVAAMAGFCVVVSERTEACPLRNPARSHHAPFRTGAPAGPDWLLWLKMIALRHASGLSSRRPELSFTIPVS